MHTLKNNGENIVARERSVSTSIRVPEDMYFALEELKRIEDKSINKLVVESIEYFLKSKKDILEQKMVDRTEIVRDLLKEL